jgi:hypothetical protein
MRPYATKKKAAKAVFTGPPGYNGSNPTKTNKAQTTRRVPRDPLGLRLVGWGARR